MPDAGGGLSIDTRGMFAGLDRFRKASREALDRGLAKAGGQLLADCVTKYPAVPIDEGDLRGSGTVHVAGEVVEQSPPGGGDDTPMLDFIPEQAPSTAWVGFNRPQAAKLHEREHNWSDSSAGKHYISDKLDQFGGDYLEIIADEIKSETGR